MAQPADPPSAAQIAPEVPDRPSQPLAPLRVVLVDDVEDIRLLLRALMAPYAEIEVVGEAEDGEAAIAVVAATQPDLVVLDLTIPVLDGLSALPRVRLAAPAARVVVLTAMPLELADRVLSAGAVAFVQKAAGRTEKLVPDLLAAAGLLDATLDTLGQRSHRTDLPLSPLSAGLARRFADDVLRADRPTVVETVQLLLSELVTNSVVHATSAPTVAMHLFPDHVRVEVMDDDVSRPAPRSAGDDAVNGRGMALVDAIAQDWGVIPLESGKIVWFDVAR